MRIWGRLRHRLSDVPPIAVDASLAIAMIVATIWLGGDYRAPGFRTFDGQAWVLTCLVNLPLSLRRRAPVPVLLASCAAVVWYFGEGYVPAFNLFGPLLALYTVAAMRPARTATSAAALTVAVVFYSGLTAEVYTVGTAMAQALVATAVAWLFGTGARRLADRNDRLLELAEQLRQEREERARSAVVAEQVRIARELHDVVAHHMSVISVQAGLARYVLATDPATSGNALDTIVDTSHEALEEMRRLLTVLRVADADRQTDGRGYDPAPGLGRLDELVDRVRSAGVPVEVVVTGTACPLPPGADLCAYRVVQESLTNVLKHARNASVVVELDYRTAGLLTIRIVDDGPGAAPGPVTGHGLIGMHERARLYGGSVHTGPGSEGGFSVTLALPTGASAGDDSEAMADGSGGGFTPAPTRPAD
ncbi:sensor histidine kinase [Micromonospora sonneratiae]|uniref:histidine kinase n=1 Tax=Micromonospora sonneratiae TaxID=1184706 RepID=A0ABW3YLQ6_9ACTN